MEIREQQPVSTVRKTKTLKIGGKHIRPSTILMSAVLVWFIAIFLIYPNINTILTVFWQDGEFTLRAFERVFNSPIAVSALRNSFILAPILSVTVGFVGISLVLITDYFAIKGATILRLGYMTTLLYGGIILVSGYRFLYGAGGFLTNIIIGIFPYFNPNWFEGFWAVLFVMTFAATGGHLIFIRNAIRTVDYQTIEAAKNMGASTLTILLKVVLPVLTPSLIVVTVLTFLGGLAAIAAPLLVGGRDFQTINPMILSFSAMQNSRDLAALMALFLGVASFILIGFLSWLERRGHYLSVSKTKTEMTKQEIKNPVFKALAHIYAYLLFVIYTAPVVLIVLFSFTNDASIIRRELSFSAFTLENYISAFTNRASIQPLLTSLLYSFVASALAGIMMIFVCRVITKSKGKFAMFLEYAFMIPWLLPSALIALGLLMSFDRPRWFVGNQPLIGTMGIMILGYVIVIIPFTLRMTRSAFFAIDDTLEDAAKNLGASSFYTFYKVILPIISPSLLAIFALNFNLLLSEFEMSRFLFHPLARPLGVHIESLTMDGGGSGIAYTFVYAVIMMAISAIVLWVTYGRKSGNKSSKAKVQQAPPMT